MSSSFSNLQLDHDRQSDEKVAVNLSLFQSMHVGPWMVRQYVPSSPEHLVPPGFFTFKFEPHPEDMGDRKTVEQQVQDPRTIEYTDKNQVWK